MQSRNALERRTLDVTVSNCKKTNTKTRYLLQNVQDKRNTTKRMLKKKENLQKKTRTTCLYKQEGKKSSSAFHSSEGSDRWVFSLYHKNKQEEKRCKKTTKFSFSVMHNDTGGLLFRITSSCDANKTHVTRGDPSCSTVE